MLQKPCVPVYNNDDEWPLISLLSGKKKGDELDTHRLLIVINYSSICRTNNKLLVAAYDAFALIRRGIVCT